MSSRRSNDAANRRSSFSAPLPALGGRLARCRRPRRRRRSGVNTAVGLITGTATKFAFQFPHVFFEMEVEENGSTSFVVDHDSPDADESRATMVGAATRSSPATKSRSPICRTSKNPVSVRCRPSRSTARRRRRPSASVGNVRVTIVIAVAALGVLHVDVQTVRDLSGHWDRSLPLESFANTPGGTRDNVQPGSREAPFTPWGLRGVRCQQTGSTGRAYPRSEST